RLLPERRHEGRAGRVELHLEGAPGRIEGRALGVEHDIAESDRRRRAAGGLRGILRDGAARGVVLSADALREVRGRRLRVRERNLRRESGREDRHEETTCERTCGIHVWSLLESGVSRRPPPSPWWSQE